MSNVLKWSRAVGALAIVVALGGATIRPPEVAKPQASAAAETTVSMRRLTEGEYRRSVADIFSPDIKVEGQFEPELRESRLQAIGSAKLSVTASGFEGYYELASSIAGQVLSPENRAKFLSCQPADPKAADHDCAKQFLAKYGTRLFRHPISDAELTLYTNIADSAVKGAGDFYGGLESALTAMMISQDFLFRSEVASPDQSGAPRLDGYSRASRLSFLFWDTTPDDELIHAAESGELYTQAGLEAQVDRLSASPRLEDGVRAFFTDLLQLNVGDTIVLDPKLFPNASDAIIRDAKEQTLRTIVDLLVKQNGDYRDIVTTRKTFLDRPLASIYRVPFDFKNTWSSYEFAPDSGRSGILTNISFLAYFAHPGRTSPTIRGRAVQEILMCTPTPNPPADVDFSKVNDEGKKLATLRARLVAHAQIESCAACHDNMDPVGFAMEKFDALGQSRTLDNGAPIDDSADLFDQKFSGAQGLGSVLHDHPKLASCLTESIYAYGISRAPNSQDRKSIRKLNKAFVASGYHFRDLLKAVATSDDFYRPVALPAPIPAPATAETKG